MTCDLHLEFVSFTCLLPIAKSTAPCPAKTRARSLALLLSLKPPSGVLSDTAGPRRAPFATSFRYSVAEVLSECSSYLCKLARGKNRLCPVSLRFKSQDLPMM